MIKIAQLLLLITNIAICGFEPRITIYPGTVVEVGEKVLLSACSTTGLIDPAACFYEWDFGDGFTLRRGHPNANSAYTGPNCIHFFMKPDTYAVKLIITQKDSTKDSTTKKLVVKGESPIEGFEFWNAPIQSRISQYIYIQIPKSIYSTSSNRLKVCLIKNQVDTTILLNKSSLRPEEIFLLDKRKLPPAEYELYAVLISGNNQKISCIKEKFSKNYEGLPKVGINENNAICINGKPFFPVTPWLLRSRDIPNWNKKYVNSANGVGYYDINDISTWSDYLDICKENGILAIGPERWDGLSNAELARNSDIMKLTEYVNKTKNHEGLMMWSWRDEPNMGGRDGRIPGPVNAAWSYVCHILDQQHPVASNLYGICYLPYYNNKGDDYDFLNNAQFFGGKKHLIFDAIGFDIYPIQSAEHASLKGRRVISEYAEAIDFVQQQNYYLLPFISFIEVQKLRNSLIAPSFKQILMEAWLNVIHGAKGISWFHYFGETPQESLDAMELFYKQVTQYSNIILGPANGRIVKDDANIPGKRVDLMVRETVDGIDSSIYIFAVRVTEPDSATENYIQMEAEPDSIVVTFSVPGITEHLVISELENREIPIKNGIFIDTFGKCDYRVYRIGRKQPIMNQNRNNIKSKVEYLKLPQFNTKIPIRLNNSIGKGKLTFYNLNGALLERIESESSTYKPRSINRTGLYIVKQDNMKKNNRILLIK